MALFVVLFVALVALAIVFAPLMLPGALFVAVIFGLVVLVLHVHRHHVLRSHHDEEPAALDREETRLTSAPEEMWAKLGDIDAPTFGSPMIGEATESTIGLDLVRALHNAVRPSVVAHDAVLEAGVCPILSGLSGGSALADRVRCGSDKRAELLERFEAVSRHFAPHNVYPVAGAEVERVLDGLHLSLREHADEETSAVCDLCPRVLDSVSDWDDSHFGWPDHGRRVHSPRTELVNVLKREADASPSSARRVLEAWDDSIDAIAAELKSAPTDVERGGAAHRLMAAIAIHDSVESGILCPILKRAPRGESLAARLHEGFVYHALLQRFWNELTTGGVGADDVYKEHRKEAEDVLTALVESFRAHRRDDMAEIAVFLENLPAASYRTVRSPLDDVMWPWHSEGPALLAIRMALWAESAPTRAHALSVKHPSSRTLRSLSHFADHFLDSWGETWLEQQFILPRRHPRPFTRAAGAP